MCHFIGIDNSSSDHKVQVLDQEGNKRDAFTIQNNLSGFDNLDKRIQGYSEPIFGFELPHGPLVDFLHEKQYSMYSLNPLKVKRFKEILTVSGNKNDKIDALAIAEYLRKNKSQVREMQFNSSKIERLRTMMIIYERTVRNKARHLNKLHFAVKQYFPLHEGLFSAFGANIQLKLLSTYPIFAQLKAASDEELTEFLIKNKYTKRSLIEKLLKKIRSYRQCISPEVEFAYKFEVLSLCQIIAVLNNELNELAIGMKTIVDSHSLGKVFKSIPGSGDILSSKLLALFGDNKNRFNNYNDVQCLFGTAPRNYQSGGYHKVMMRKACNKIARAILYQHAFSSLRYCKWAREYYDKQRSRGKRHSVALRALSNKWVKVMYKIWKNEVLYSEEIKLRQVA